MMHGLRDRGNRAAGIDEDRPALALQRPASVLAERDVLPADLAHAVRGRCRSGGFEIDDADDLTRGPASTWARRRAIATLRSEEHTSALQSLMRISYAVCCLHIKKYLTYDT